VGGGGGGGGVVGVGWGCRENVRKCQCHFSVGYPAPFSLNLFEGTAPRRKKEQ